MSKLDWMYENYMKATEKDIDELRVELLEKKKNGTLNIQENEDEILRATETSKEGAKPSRLVALQMMFAMTL